MIINTMNGYLYLSHSEYTNYHISNSKDNQQGISVWKRIDDQLIFKYNFNYNLIILVMKY